MTKDELKAFERMVRRFYKAGPRWAEAPQAGSEDVMCLTFDTLLIYHGY